MAVLAIWSTDRLVFVLYSTEGFPFRYSRLGVCLSGRLYADVWAYAWQHLKRADGDGTRSSIYIHRSSGKAEWFAAFFHRSGHPVWSCFGDASHRWYLVTRAFDCVAVTKVVDEKRHPAGAGCCASRFLMDDHKSTYSRITADPYLSPAVA